VVLGQRAAPEDLGEVLALRLLTARLRHRHDARRRG
jgi:hypothetical protein